MTRWLRAWSWNKSYDFYHAKRCLVPHLISRFFFAIAEHYDRDPRRCWALLAMWAMGFDSGDLNGSLDPGCDWCGKCQKPEARDA